MSGSSSSTSSRDAPPRAAAVVVAGGAGTRMAGAAGGVRKQYLSLLGEPILLWAVRPFLDHPAVASTVVVLPPEDAADPPEWLRALPVQVVAGGAERGDSVWSGLQAVPESAELVLIHDGARPLVTRAVIDRVLEGARSGGAIAAVRVTDTIKEADEAGCIVGTADRARLWQAQTPQGFPRRLIVEAYRQARAAGWRATDDAALCERLGHPVRVVEGGYENLKITRPLDLPLAEALAQGLRAG